MKGLFNRRGEPIGDIKVELPRLGMDNFWDEIKEKYAQENPRKWKQLAVLCLRENSGWETEMIGLAFNHPKGHISRILVTIKAEIRKRFEIEPSMIHGGQEEENFEPFGSKEEQEAFETFWGMKDD
jgi:hypothetical protein